MLSIKNMAGANQRNIPLWIVAFTLLFRLILLAIKPAHFDEGVNGWFVDQLVQTGIFRYDPGNYHGPLHFYILFLSKVMLGRNLWALRLPVVLIGVLAVYLVTKFDRFIDRRACWIAALAMAVSPGMEFYGRYAIHETELMLFLILTTWGLAGMFRFGTVQYLWATGLGVTGMVLTKETYVIHLTAFALAGLCLMGVEKYLPGDPPLTEKRTLKRLTVLLVALALGFAIFFASRMGMEAVLHHFKDPAKLPGFRAMAWHALITIFSTGLGALFFWIAQKLLLDLPYQPKRQKWAWLDLFYVAATCIWLIVFFYSGAFRDFSILKGLYLTFSEWVKTGQAGNGHEKSPIYWLMLVGRYEWPALVGMIVSLVYIWPRNNRFIRYMAIYGFGALTAYSIVRYKTPWCVISIIWPFYFALGQFFKDWIDTPGGRRPALIVCSLLLTLSLGYSVVLNFFRYTNENEPYVYVQTLNDINKLTDPLFQLAKQDPQNYHLRGHVILSSYHPLPWVLGDFTQIGYYSDDPPRDEDMDADFLVVDVEHEAEVEGALKEEYFVQNLKLRGALDTAKLYLNSKKFQSFFPGQKPTFVQGKAVPFDKPAGEQP